MKIPAIKIIVFLFLNTIYVTIATAQPCKSGFKYRVPIIFDNTGNSGLVSQQLKLTLNTTSLVSAGKLQSSGSDLRILDRFGSTLNFWIEDGTMNTSTTHIWVKVDSIKGYSKDTIYFFYGNSSASSVSSASNVFTLYDDFNGSTLDALKWNACGSGSFTVSGGNITLTSTSGSSGKAIITSVSSIDLPYVLEMEVQSWSGGKALIGQVNSSGNGYGMVLNTNMGIETLSAGTNCFSSSALGSAVSPSTTNGLWSFAWRPSNIIEGSWPGGSLNRTDNTYNPGSKGKVQLGNFDNSGNIALKWVRVRKYSNATPSYTFGTEVSMDYTINASYQSPLCAGGDLRLKIDTVRGARYKWTGPNGFTSILQNPVVTGVLTSDAGLYVVTVEIPTSCASKSTSVNVTVSPKAVGGTIAGSQSVCSGSNIGVLSLSGHTGNVQNWDSSTSISGPWYSIAKTSLSITYNNLVKSMYYRAIVVNSGCSVDTSTKGLITVTPGSIGGKVTGNDTACSGSNSGVVNLSGYTGSITSWEYSENGNLWFNIINRGTDHAYSNLTKTTYYRAVIQNGLCAEERSSPAIITINQPSLGGTVSGSATVCDGFNSGILELTNHRGQVIRWEYSSTGSSPWTAISNKTDTLGYKNVTANSWYRAIVKNGKCSFTNSSTVALNVTQRSKAGGISGSTTVCEGSNFGILTQSSSTGSIEKWLSYSKSSSVWSTISSTSSTISWSGLSDTTQFKIVVKNGTCPSDTSQSTYIYVNPQSQSGYLSGNSDVCEGSNKGTIKLKAWLGTIKGWETSLTGFAPWTSVTNTTDSLQFTNLTETTHYRAIIQSGVCSKSYTNSVNVMVDPKTIGGVLSKDDTVCSGNNFGILTLSGKIGGLERWETSEDGSNWTKLSQFGNTYTYANLTKSNYYRAVVKSGVCNEENSSNVLITVNTETNGGDIYGDATSCGEINAGFIKLRNHNGKIVQWESSYTGKSPWKLYTTEKDSFEYTNIPKTTFFRALVKNGQCAAEYSPVSVVNISLKSNAGLLESSSYDVCEGNNVGNLTLKSYVGDIIIWQTKPKSKSNWTDIKNITERELFFNLTETMNYRVMVQSSSCPTDTSNEVTIKVSEPSFAGTIFGQSTQCIKNNEGSVFVKDITGEVIRWESSYATTGPWINIGNAKDTLHYSNADKEIYYRAIVKNGLCSATPSLPAKISLDYPSVSGKIIAPIQVCQGVNSGEIVLMNNLGSVSNWQKSSSPSGPWVDVNSYTSRLSYLNINTEEYYRAIVKNGVCFQDTTQPVLIKMLEVPQVNFTSTKLCEGSVSTFISKSSMKSGKITEYYWKISDGYSGNDSLIYKSFVNQGTFIVNHQVKSDSGCIGTFTKTIRVDQSPIAEYYNTGNSGINTTCNIDTAIFNNVTRFPDLGSCTYLWDFGDSTASSTFHTKHRYNVPGNYKVKLLVETPNNCKDSIEKYITVFATMKPNAGEDKNISKGIPYKLNGTGGIIYEWSPAKYLNNASISNPTITVDTTTLFVLKTIDYNGCAAYDSVLISVSNDFKVIPNNIITPEGNGDNDLWIIKNIESYPDNHISVFDRWGREVMKSDGYKNDWGATDKSGSLLTDGTFYYVISFDSSPVVQKGAITVIRNK